MACSKPSLAASLRRFSDWLTDLISPDKPISPKTTVRGGNAAPTAASAAASAAAPASLAASCTALPLCSTAPQAAAYCALFLAVNGWNLVHARSRSARARPGLAAPSA